MLCADNLNNIKKALNRIKWIHYMAWVLQHKECQQRTLSPLYAQILESIKLHNGRYKTNVPNFKIMLALMNLGLVVDVASAYEFVWKSTNLCNAYLQHIFEHVKPIPQYHIDTSYQDKRDHRINVIKLLSIVVLLFAILHMMLLSTVLKGISLVPMVSVAFIEGAYASYAMYHDDKIAEEVAREKYEIKAPIDNAIKNITQIDLVSFEIMHVRAIPHVYDPYGKYLNEIQYNMFNNLEDDYDESDLY